MSLERVSQPEVARQLGLVDEAGDPSARGVAQLLRQPLARWGLASRRAVLGHAREHLQAVGLTDMSIAASALDSLIALRECDEVSVAGERYLAPAEPRWLRVGGSTANFLGVAGPPVGVPVEELTGAGDIVQRITVETDEHVASLELAGARETTLAEWLTPAGYLRHAARRQRRPVRSDKLPLEAFWDLLCVALGRDGLPLGDDAEIRAMCGEPGGFFGSHRAESLEGRWTAEPPDGVWCAFRRGYGEAHWHPILIERSTAGSRVLDLFDQDEWGWALLARGRAVGPDEIVQRSPGTVQLTFRAPLQVLVALDMLGPRTGAWTWSTLPGAPDPFHLLM